MTKLERGASLVRSQFNIYFGNKAITLFRHQIRSKIRRRLEDHRCGSLLDGTYQEGKQVSKLLMNRFKYAGIYLLLFINYIITIS